MNKDSIGDGCSMFLIRVVSFAAFSVSLLLILQMDGGNAQASTGETLLDCDFENETNHFCDFIQDSTDDFDWTWHAGSTATENTGPSVDHTFGSENGHYIYTESSRPQQHGDLSRLLTPMLAPTTTSKCFSFYYQLNGQDVGRLRVKLQPVNNTDQQLLREWRGDQGNVWLKAGITIPPQSSMFQILFESEVGENYRGDVAIDDILLVDGVCPLDGLVCTFEDQGLCGYTQDRTDDFNFRWQGGGTRAWNTGPDNDHTYKNESGHYVYMEAGYRQEGHQARLISPMFAGHSGQPSCLIFFYHMYGNMMGDLNVYIKNSTSDGLGKPVWGISGNRGNKWRAVEVQITTPFDYQVIFEGERGESSQGDIGIDDANVTFAPCPGHYVYNNESSVTCDFEEAELCHYTQNKDDDFDWRWDNRGTWWRFTGPSVDHTRGDELGFFLFIEAGWYTPRNALARITSPEVPGQRQSSCLEFWYHMYGKDVEDLKVYVQTGDQLPSTAEWTETGDHGDAWHRATVDINLRNTPFKIVFEGKRGVFRRDDVAIDDVRIFKSSSCPAYPTQPPIETTTPTPVQDIGCTFESDYCGYTQAFDDTFDWIRHQGTSRWRWYKDSMTKDHTLGTSEGHYMLLQILQWWFHRTNDKARMISPLLRGSRYPRCLKFFSYLSGGYAEYLNVYMVQHGDTLSFDPDLVLYDDQGAKWEENYLDIPPSTYPIYVVFEGVIGHIYWSADTAIDDISIIDGECPKSTPRPLMMSADCDFEGVGDAVMCGFTHEKLDDSWWRWWSVAKRFNWLLNTGPTSTNNTGPPSDHTFKNMSGHYLYMDASQPQRPFDRARISSPKLASRGQRICLQFYYYMNGADMGSLSVKWSAPNYPEKQIMRVKKMSNRWLPAYVEMSDKLDNYQITFEGVVGQGYSGDIAIDDIRFLPQPCDGFEPESECGFDKDYESCDYRQDDANLLEWIWFDSKGIEPSPLGNASDSVGSFLYITGNSNTPTNGATLRPPMIPRLNMDHCLSYDVVVQNDPDASLSVAVEYTTGSWRTLKVSNTSVASTWTHLDVTIPLDTITEDPFQIKLITNFGKSLKAGIIAIDNVTMSQASCDVVIANLPSRQGGGGSSGANVALGTILALVLIGVVVMLVVAWYFIRRSSGSGDSPFAIKYKNRDENINPVSLSGEPGIANPVYEKAGLENNA